ncbi:hypothetical protein Emed_003686 [Eimeria media]
MTPNFKYEFIHTSGGFSDGSSLESWVATPGMQRRASVLKRWWLISLSAIVVLLMASICHQKLGASSLEGVQVRRLAEGEEEEHDGLPRSSSLDFVEFCYALGNWTPQASVPGEPRASPSFVEAVLAGLEAEAESGEGAATSSGPPATSEGMGAHGSGTVLKLVIYEKDSDEEGKRASSWKVESGDSAPVSLGDERSQISQAASLQPSSAFTPVHPPYTFVPVVPAPSTSSSSVLVLEEKASTSSEAPRPEAASSVSRSDPPRKHPFVHLPRLQPGVEPPQFSSALMKFVDSCSREHCTTLRIMRELFLKEELNQYDAYMLVSNAEELAKHAYAKMTTDVSTYTPTIALEFLSRRFMVFWSLYSASQVLRQDWPRQSWWRELAEIVPTRYRPRKDLSSRTLEFNYCLIRDLVEAIEQLKRGQPLPDDLVIDLKFRIFCSPQSPSRLKISSWEAWRDDGLNPSG